MLPEQDERTTGTTDDAKPDDAAEDRGAGAADVSPAGGAESEDTSREDELEKLRTEKQKWLTEKTKYEQAQRENEELRRRPPQAPATGDDAEQRALLRRDLELERELDAGVPPTLEHYQAERRLRRAREQMRIQKIEEVERKLELSRLPDDIQSEAEKLAEEEGISVKLAARLIRAERGNKAKPEDRNGDDEEIERKTARRDAQPTTVSTPASRGSDVMTHEQYRRRLAKFDDDDDTPGKAAFVRKKNEGKIRVRG